MAFLAPMVSLVTGGVFNHSESEAGELEGLPVGHAGVARVFGFGNRGPVGGLEGDGHGGTSLCILSNWFI